MKSLLHDAVMPLDWGPPSRRRLIKIPQNPVENQGRMPGSSR
ncbi:MAG TPA: hypothetical protein PLM96_00155 [Methanoregulaceae archaeon]|nr:hypothetical protein [Methanoregulaceae archaeon]MDD5684671.1 hypothetical protein [Methanoregulaceae archaeon]HOP66141.1 hypothetical protein [Methanoregulaceae archaeon]HPJ73475.1 hypothetical protein [Methanoregulaceae archaeon]HPQ75045.1 hypothetical protein [Methanoregulaceae archaeon]